MKRSEYEDRILRELLERLSEEGVPTEQDIAQVDALRFACEGGQPRI